MTKLEKVISGLQHCQRNSCNSCPYANDDGESPYRTCRQIEMFGDALELLKAVPPDAREVWIGLNGAFHWEYTCGACGCGIMRNDRWKTKYCPECGKAVKWDDEA